MGGLETNMILHLSMLCLLLKTTQTLNVSSSEELRHPRVTGRIVKLYSGVRPDPILCSREGFQADPVNCAVFYRCVKGSNDKYTVFRYQCGPGTVYDPDTEVCNHPMNTKRASCGGREFPDTASVNENEIDGARQEVLSPISTKQPLYTQQTTKVKDVTILSMSSPQSTPNHNKASQSSIIPTVYPWVTTTNQLTQATESARAVSSKPNRQIGDQCTSDGFMGDSENCRKFYRCVGNGRGGFIRYELSCSELTIWDDETQACNHAWAVKKRRCGRGNLDNDEHTMPVEENEINSNRTIQSQLQINYGSKVSQVQTQISKGSVIQNQTQINYAKSSSYKSNSNVKQNQTQISHGSAVSQTQTQINHGNNGFQTQLQIDHTKESSQSQTQINEASIEQISASQDDEIQKPYTENPANGYSSDECTESGFMGDSKDCKKFYRCVDNGRGSYIKYEFSCGEGTVWDRNAEACNHEWAVKDCKNKVAPGASNQESITTASTKAPAQDTTTVDNFTTEDEDVGYGGQNQEKTTPSSTQLNKPNTTESTIKTTQSSTTTSKSTTAGAKNVCNSSGFMGDSADCKKFYRCVDNGKSGFTKYEYNCGEGTVWDSEIEACNHAWAVKKCGSSSYDASTEKTSTSGSSSPTTATHTLTTGSEEDSDSGYGQPQNEATTISTTTLKQPNQGNTNQRNDCTSSGFMGDDKDCKKFYRCVDNGNGAYTRFEFSCGEGTVWDSKIEACNHAWAVEKCGKGTPHENTSETTTQAGTEIHDEIENGYPSQSTTDNTLTSSVSTTTNKPIMDNQTGDEGSCSMEGFFGDTKDCRKFYRCVENQQGGFTKYDFTCGEGTLWDSEINACNHMKSVKNNCSTATHSMGTTQKQPVYENDEYVENSTSEVTATLTTTESGMEKPSSSSGLCESEGFYANPDDCKKFYRCANDGKGGYIKYDFSCGDGTVWDEQAQTCNHESSQTKCSQNVETSTSEKPQSNSEANIQTELAMESTTSKKTPVDITTSNNKDQCTSEGFYANSNDCKKFFRCVDNGKDGYTKYDFSCGDGTVWVQEIQACDHDNDVSNCNSQMVSSTPSYQEEQHSSTDSSTFAQSSTTERQNDDTSSAQLGSNQSTSTRCNSEGFFANKKDCRKFYRCVDNGKGGFTSYDFTCGEGTAWDSEIEACNHIDQVTNCQGSENENQSDSSTVDENPSQTTEGTSITKTSTTKSTDENKKPQNTEKCENEGYFGNSEDCKKFYRCVDNGNGGLTKYDYTCGEGTIWDQHILACNHPQDVQNPSCNNNTSATATESSNDGSSTASGSITTSEVSPTSSSTEGQHLSECSQSSTEKPQNKNVNCTKAGFYADPDDCKKFYRCVDWDNNGKRFSVYHFECGEGTIWDPEVETCNHEDSVYPPRDCSEKQTQNTTDGSITTTEKTQKSTTTEESMTETTSEQTTQTSTSTIESATTQQSTEATTTSEKSTTEQSSTTQKSTTTEKSTTQQSSSTEHSTTENEQKTTQQSTTSEQTTQQSSTTHDETTTTEQGTTVESTTEQSTTEQSTAEQSTTEQSTTEQSTTKESTTEQSTTEQSTTEQSTTEQSTTEQSTAEQSTTEHSTTEQSTAEQSTTEQSTTEQSTTEQSTTEQTTTEQTTTEQSTTENSTENSSEPSSTTEETTTQESSTTESSTTEPSSSTTDQESTTESSPNSKACPETADDQDVYVCPTSFRRHPKYCNMFYQCTEEEDSRDLHIAVFKCPNNTIYDESKTQCVDKEKADEKCDGEIEERKRVKRLNTNFKEPIIVSKEPLVCPGTGHYPFEKSDCSPAFLKCNETKTGRLRGYVHRCPEGYVYWTISRRCENKASVRDCKQTANDWRGRWEIPTEKKNIAT